MPLSGVTLALYPLDRPFPTYATNLGSEEGVRIIYAFISSITCFEGSNEIHRAIVLHRTALRYRKGLIKRESRRTS